MSVSLPTGILTFKFQTWAKRDGWIPLIINQEPQVAPLRTHHAAIFSSRSVVYYSGFCCLQQHSVVYESPPVDTMLYLSHFNDTRRIFLTVVFFLCIENCRLLFNSGSHFKKVPLFLVPFSNRFQFINTKFCFYWNKKTIAQRRPSFIWKVKTYLFFKGFSKMRIDCFRLWPRWCPCRSVPLVPAHQNVCWNIHVLVLVLYI